MAYVRCKLGPPHIDSLTGQSGSPTSALRSHLLLQSILIAYAAGESGLRAFSTWERRYLLFHLVVRWIESLGKIGALGIVF